MVPGNSWRNLGESLPFYVAREYNGVQASMHFPLWFVLTATLLFMFNLLLWGSIGLFVAVKTIIEAVV